MSTIGKNILDNLTTGMYQDSKVIYREYIQNASDSIDAAIKSGILDINDNSIEIQIDKERSYISIEDNGLGIKNDEFKQKVGDIANSDKIRGVDKGFRGIGRLCGLGYCEKLVFTSSFSGEPVKSTMICDAKLMKELLVSKEKILIDDIWDKIIKFEDAPEDKESHYFKVELYNINKTNDDLLNCERIISYLNFVAPLPFVNRFNYRSLISKYASELNYKIDEYNITLNDKQLFKNYSTRIKKSDDKYDEIIDIQFKNFYNSKKQLICWMWYGISTFDGVIPIENEMRGIRIRCGNIQIGDSNVFDNRHLFKEERGGHYYIGEIYICDNELIPNSQRDYFQENDNLLIFEKELKKFFSNDLHELYHNASKLRSAMKIKDNYVKSLNEYNDNIKNKSFINKDDKVKAEQRISELKNKAEGANKTIEAIKLKFQDEQDNPNNKVIMRFNELHNQDELDRKIEKKEKKVEKNSNNDVCFVNKLSKLSKKERKLVSEILEIINENIDDDETMKNIMKSIEKSFK